MKLKLIFIIALPFIIFPLFIENFRNYSYLNYLIQLVFFLCVLLFTKRKVRLIFSPAFFTVTYLYISFLFGDLLFKNDLYLDYRQYYYYKSWRFFNLSNVYINLCAYLSLLSYYASLKGIKPLNIVTNNILNTRKIRYGIVLLFICLLPFASYDILDGFIKTFLGILSIMLIYLFSPNKSRLRFLYYILIMASLAIANPDDKRDSIFLFFIIAFIELRKIQCLKIKTILLLIIGVSSVAVLILVMSIFRANLATNVKDAINEVPKYVSSEAALPIIADNFEVNYVYINTFTPIEFIEKDPTLLNYGMSYVKPLFLFISRDIFPEKPLATMVQYTNEFDYAASRAGYCLPINIASEAYWNFGFWGFIVTFIIYFILNRIYNRGYAINECGKKQNFNEFIYIYFLYITYFLIRGSGFDIYIYNIIVMFICVLFFRFFFSLLNFNSFKL